MYQTANSGEVSNPSTDTQITKTLLYEIADIIRMYIYPVVILFGTSLNILSIKVFRRPALRHSTTSFLIITLAAKCDCPVEPCSNVTDITSQYKTIYLAGWSNPCNSVFELRVREPG